MNGDNIYYFDIKILELIELGKIEYMSDDDLLGGFPPRGAKDGNNIVFVHNYNNVHVVSQGSNAQFTGAINDSTEVLLMQYFRGTTKEADKLKIIAFAQETFSAKEDKKE